MEEKISCDREPSLKLGHRTETRSRYSKSQITVLFCDIADRRIPARTVFSPDIVRLRMVLIELADFLDQFDIIWKEQLSVLKKDTVDSNDSTYFYDYGVPEYFTHGW
jgi:hypothetical protein